MTDRTIRRARAGDHGDVAAFTRDTWSDRDVGDYIPDVFPEWVDGDGPTQRTAVAEVDGTIVGLCQGVLLSEEEAWFQGMRVAPGHRGADHGRALTEHLMDWAADAGATVGRNMVFDWNPPGMGQSRALGFVAATSCRWARPEPDGDGPPPTDAFGITDDVATAWRFWTDSEARTTLDGLALATDETWALSDLDRRRLATIADRGRVFAVSSDGVRGVAARLGTRERDGETVADYAVGAWADADACRGLFAEIRADADRCGADDARVPIPDTPRFVSDAALARIPLDDDAAFVCRVDLTTRR